MENGRKQQIKPIKGKKQQMDPDDGDWDKEGRNDVVDVMENEKPEKVVNGQETDRISKFQVWGQF